MSKRKFNPPIHSSNPVPAPKHVPVSSTPFKPQNVNSPLSEFETQNRSSSAVNEGENVKVCVRVRPLNDMEMKRGDNNVLSCSEEFKSLKFLDLGSKKEKMFTYDVVLNENCSQQRTFDTCGIKDLVDISLQGYSSTIFAYGQTGSGKTHTIVGRHPQKDANHQNSLHYYDGIIPRAAEYLCEQMKQILLHQKVKMSMRAQYLEIYNEHVNDLLNLQSVNLPVRWNNKDGFFVENLLVVQCTCYEDIMAVVQEGVSNRKVSAHEMNKDSSRSHSIFTIYLDINEQIGPNNTIKRIGKIHFVDLAGSERLKETKGGNAIETGHINKSLLTLGKVITYLADNSNGNKKFIPFRESKLTQLLMDSLGGTCKTIMIACVTPSSSNAEETLNTLKYASRTKKIKNNPQVNFSDPNAEMISNLKDEINYLREYISVLEQGVAIPGHTENGNQLTFEKQQPQYQDHVKYQQIPNAVDHNEKKIQQQVQQVADASKHSTSPSFQDTNFPKPNNAIRVINPLKDPQKKPKQTVAIANPRPSVAHKLLKPIAHTPSPAFQTSSLPPLPLSNINQSNTTQSSEEGSFSNSSANSSSNESGSAVTSKSYYPSDPKYAQVLAEKERLENEILELKELLSKTYSENFKPKSEPNVAEKKISDDEERLKRENIELTNALQSLRRKLQKKGNQEYEGSDNEVSTEKEKSIHKDQDEDKYNQDNQENQENQDRESVGKDCQNLTKDGRQQDKGEDEVHDGGKEDGEQQDGGQKDGEKEDELKEDAIQEDNNKLVQDLQDEPACPENDITEKTNVDDLNHNSEAEVIPEKKEIEDPENHSKPNDCPT